jgi:hypothetical protein
MGGGFPSIRDDTPPRRGQRGRSIAPTVTKLRVRVRAIVGTYPSRTAAAHVVHGNEK